jgi:hypothetical protein
METIQEPSPLVVDPVLEPVRQFLSKTAILSTAIVMSLWIIFDMLDDFAVRRMQQLEQTIQSATAVGGRRFWAELEQGLEELASPGADMSPEKREKILAQIRAISDRWRPFLVEAASAIDGKGKTPAH